MTTERRPITKLSDRQAILQAAATLQAADITAGTTPQAEFRYVGRAMRLWNQVQDSCERLNRAIESDAKAKRQPKRKPPADKR